MDQPSSTALPAWSPVSPREAEAAALLYFGLHCRASALDGDQDQNFRLRGLDGSSRVLKFYHPQQDPEALAQQTRVLSALGALETGLQCPEVLPNLAGEALTSLENGGMLRLLSWVEGIQWFAVRPHSPALLSELGSSLARLAEVLQGIAPAAKRGASPWNLLQAAATIRARLDCITSPERRALLERWLPRIEPALARAAQLPAVLLHNDANDYNVLVSPAQPGCAERRVSGLIDFGDLCQGPRVIDPATAAAYACLHKQDPLGTIAQVAAGYHSVSKLDALELELFSLLSVARLCLSVAMSAQQQRERPENAYLAVSEAPAWEALERLAPLDDGLLQARLRDAAGLAPSLLAERLQRALGTLESLPVLPAELYANVMELDLSIASQDFPSELTEDPEAWQAELTRRMAECGAGLAVGRYAEARLCYTGEPYGLPGEDRELRRSVHLGIDLFAPAGTPVHAPLDAKVFSVHDNCGARNYGPTVILEHRIGRDLFYSLYGHLGRALLSRLKPGVELRAGERFAELGDASENGGWPAHLHIQWIADRLGELHDFPGVAAPEQGSLWLGLSPDPRRLAGLGPATEQAADDQVSLLAERRRHHGGALSLSYKKPLSIVRGKGSKLYDSEGRCYLDAVNNVPHVGHCHPHVVRAAARQMAVLNTNTRYLDRERQRYMRRLCATFPAPLSVCFLVCSGSEANELALRLARAHSGKQGVAVLSAAYHGNSSSLVELSPYKFEGRGGAGRPAHVQVVPAPDDYRGQWKRDDAERGKRYGDLLRAAIENGRACGHPIGAFFAESVLGCAGQIPLPPGFLAEAYAHVRAAGGLCIADEVQVGFGRVGSHFWAFESQQVVPDIVTLGKPMGNGHPLAGVLTTPEVAASFDRGMEYFNTFGGNPVSAAVGNAVLDVIEAEGLQANASRVGAFLRRGLEDLAQRHEIIGDVRGAGLFLGLELVQDRLSLAPAPAVADYVAERMRDRGVLISTDGPLHNVLKIKPPLVFDQGDAELLLNNLDQVLQEDPARPGAWGNAGELQ